MYLADISTQLKNIMPALGLGFVLGLVYEFVRVLRLYISSRKVFVFITDMLFTVFSSVAVFLLFVAVDNGHMRAYMILSCVLGYVICLFTAGELIYTFFVKIHSFAVRFTTLFLKPIVFVGRKMIPKLKKVSENTEKIKNKFKNLLKRSIKVLYNSND